MSIMCKPLSRNFVKLRTEPQTPPAKRMLRVTSGLIGGILKFDMPRIISVKCSSCYRPTYFQFG